VNKAIVLVIAAVAAIAVALFWEKVLRIVSRESAPQAQVFVSDPRSDKRIVVNGWTPDELTRILGDFAKLYELDRSFASRVKAADSSATIISFPRDIPPDLFFFLVNYLNYPKGNELAGRHIAVAGKATVTATFDPPEPSLVGMSAKVYVPENDKTFDVVYINFRSGESYEISFTDQMWKRVQAARMPRAVQGL
jgi:hypothetical protein